MAEAVSIKWNEKLWCFLFFHEMLFWNVCLSYLMLVYCV